MNDQDEYGSIKVLSARGRIGCLRYIAYTIGITLFVCLVMVLLLGILAGPRHGGGNVRLPA